MSAFDSPDFSEARGALPGASDKLSVTQLGLGCVTFGREIDRLAAFAMMDHAIARGVTVFDTAAAYGNGASELIVGEWLASRGTRDRITVASKLLPPFTPASIEASMEASLRRLRVEALDVLFLHRWDATALEPGALRALDALVRQGTVRMLGASNFSAENLVRLLERETELGLTPVAALQNIHNYAVRGIDAPLREICARANIAITTYSPLGAGFLTGKHDARVQPGSRFDIMPAHQEIYFNDLARGRLARLKEISTRTGVPATQLALAWALNQPHVATVLIGGRTAAHIDQALQARSSVAPEILRILDAD
jgi:aryl-alcohol dehydrogenase-like predicted oxidoreductase